MSLTVAGPYGITIVIESPPPVPVNPNPSNPGGGDPGTPGGGTPGSGTGGGGREVLFTQDAPSTSWRIPHGAKNPPDVTVLNAAGVVAIVSTRHEPGVVYIEPDIPFAGRAVLRWNTSN